VRDLFREDAAAHYQDLLTYGEPELQTLETGFAWIDQLAADAISDARELIDQLDEPLLAKAFQDELVSQNPNITNLSKRIRAKHASAPSRTKRGATKRMKRRRRVH
jgi:hypothetical protein